MLRARNRLFDPITLGPLLLPNRVIMSSMSRDRSPGGVPTDVNAVHYAQRASAGLVITESTAVSARAVGWPNTPGIFADEQVAGWRGVPEAVHAQGGRIFSQLWHCGRNSHPLTQPGGALPVGPSAILVRMPRFAPYRSPSAAGAARTDVGRNSGRD